MLYTLAERIFLSIDFIEGKNANEGGTSEPKKMTNLTIFEKFNFSAPKPSILLFRLFFDIFGYF